MSIKPAILLMDLYEFKNKLLLQCYHVMLTEGIEK